MCIRARKVLIFFLDGDIFPLYYNIFIFSVVSYTQDFGLLTLSTLSKRSLGNLPIDFKISFHRH